MGREAIVALLSRKLAGRLPGSGINDLPIQESVRLFHWPIDRRPDDSSALSDPGL